MHRLALATLLLTTGCAPMTTVSAPPAPPSASASTPAAPATPAVGSAGPAPAPTPVTFRNSAPQARRVATVVTFIDAYNGARLDAALALLTTDVSLSDCDYRTASTVSLSGTDAVRQWLTDRAADRDQLVLESIVNENPDPTARVVAVSYAKRTSDTLRSLGFSNGVTPRIATKVVFTMSDDRIRAFQNGGNSELCRPTS